MKHAALAQQICCGQKPHSMSCALPSWQPQQRRVLPATFSGGSGGGEFTVHHPTNHNPATHQLRLATIFWRPGNLNLARRSASSAITPWLSLQRMDSRIWPMATRAHTPNGLPNAPRMPAAA